ncbi:hypothetical protein [Ornithinimicrobium avium]|uniref:Uncharacterized protein n=1 Tax=Ornithinimicrobium avium TaxID=2283195 RepID=A0A345NNL9_9MICO|nr:hypothetical protein [Ornithinimicrobium avium]AXH96627.1 hypothetical protein DV701_11280 [Ornithinimicrobium avium]
MNPDELFGAPTWFPPLECQRWIRVLSRTWFALMGRPPELLEDDLDAMAAVFGTGVSARTLKARVYKLPAADEETTELPGQVAVLLDGSALITPEGRILLDVLMQLQRTGATEIDTASQLRALSVATNLRVQWQATWMQKQFNSSISPAVLGAAMFLLLNGSVGAERALFLAKDKSFDIRLGMIVQPLIASFSEALGRDQPAQTQGLRGHWAFSQVSRLMGRDVARDTTAEGALMYVRPGRQDHLTREVASRLNRLQDEPRVHVAVLDFVEEYRRRRGPLAALGQMHEDPTSTRRMTETLLGRAGAL